MVTATTTATTSTVPTPATKLRSLELVNGKVVEFISNDAIEADYVPVIDVSRMYSSDLSERQALAKEIGHAARNVGFLTIANHGVDMALAKAVFKQAREFFGQETEKKMQVYTGLMPNEYIGYHPMHEYNANDKKYQDLYEAYNWNFEEDASATEDGSMPPPVSNLWPGDLPEFRKTLATYQAALVGLARRMTRMFALALQLPETAFDDYVKTPEASMRILHYPIQQASRDDQNGIGAHTDVEHFTMITQDCDGLEVLRKDGQWVKVRPVADSFVVNIADCFMRQTNDTFVSTVHRVINTGRKARYSCPFFFGFNRVTVMTPIPSCVSDSNPHKYPVTTAGEYYLWRTKRQKERGLGARTAKPN
ncbi:hypothetical protein SPBR_00676 [Sporothrix brasiliensis 5110]|uniref:Fe2OG dioxygenase domain-containing protein n=1 Tax=Sporothrix brasiliensis 5110 TaxID=1398154 RepID=A0A0C2IUL2_9PEZI|nr:uncharacterized protein SPBR_00676 [Sporothrix brasiliensis 5110]KIH90460.1 hypothetical protein SPBR_00676 [Sporothrix brasiliensis 5110]